MSSLPPVVSRADWLAARKSLLAQEKALTRARDAVNTKRRLLPMVELDQEYVFGSPRGELRMTDVFEGRRQLIVYHAMWLEDRGIGCPSCSAFLDQIGHLAHLHARDTTFAAVSRGPIDQIEAFKARMGWTFPWYSSHGSDFNCDFHVSNDESIAPIEYNYKDKATLLREGLDYVATDGADGQGISVFVRDDGRVFHTYSAYGVGADVMLSTYRFLDLTPLGRQRYINEWPWHHTYGASDRHAHHH